MKIFKDNAGRDWNLEINVSAVKRVKALIGVDLMDAVEGKLIERLANDPVLLCDVVYALAKPQAEEKGVSDEDFGRAMAGDAVDRAAEAFLEELADFFPSTRRRLLKKALGRMRELEGKAAGLIEKRIDGPELEDEIERLLAAPGGSSGGSQGSPGSIPAG